MITHLWGEDRKAGKVAFASAKLAVTNLFHILDFADEESEARGGKGNSSRCPHGIKPTVPCATLSSPRIPKGCN